MERDREIQSSDYFKLSIENIATTRLETQENTRHCSTKLKGTLV